MGLLSVNLSVASLSKPTLFNTPAFPESGEVAAAAAASERVLVELDMLPLVKLAGSFQSASWIEAQRLAQVGQMRKLTIQLVAA